MIADMTLRDHFAAHAPEPPEWWSESPWVGHQYPAYPAVWEAARIEHYLDYTRDWFKENCIEGCFNEKEWWTEELQAATDAYCAEDAANRELEEKQRMSNRLFRITSWRWAYADAMIAERND